MKKLIVVLTLLCAFKLNAQINFFKEYSDTSYQYGYSVKQTFDKGYIATGYWFTSMGTFRIYLVKTDSLGDSLWTRRYTVPDMVGFDVIQTKDSNYVVGGYYGSSGKGQLRKISKNGTQMWLNTYTFSGNYWVQSLQECYDGGFITGGARLFKTNSTGNLIWSKITSDQIMYVIQAKDSNFVRVGFQSSPPRILLTKTDTAGIIKWQKFWPGSIINTSNNCMTQTKDGGYVVAARTASTATSYLMRMDRTGDTVWTKRYPSFAYFTSIVQTTDGGYAMSGQTTSGFIGMQKTDSAGLLKWSSTSFLSISSEAKSIRQTIDKGYILCGGVTHPVSGDENLLLIKTDSLGTCLATNIQGKEFSTESGLLLYPNPSTGKFKVKYDSFLRNRRIHVIVINSFGEKIRSFDNYDPEFEIDLSDEPQGIYFVRVGNSFAKVVKE